jgi:hypothetical protein
MLKDSNLEDAINAREAITGCSGSTRKKTVMRLAKGQELEIQTWELIGKYRNYASAKQRNPYQFKVIQKPNSKYEEIHTS